jgi:hypothetical protein
MLSRFDFIGLHLSGRSLCLLLFCILLNGCASIEHDAQVRPILVESQPPGAHIFIDGEDVGTTPKFVFAERKRHPQIEIQLGKDKRAVNLKTRYRWGVSFWSNFIFYVGAPVGWLVDLMTGAAWDPEDPAKVDFGVGAVARDATPHITQIAIAPPRADTLSLSDAAGLILEKKLRERLSGQCYVVRPYGSTLSDFIQYKYDYDSPSWDTLDRRFLVSKLNVDQIAQSTLSESGNGGLLLNVGVDTAISGKKVDSLSLEVDSNDAVSNIIGTHARLFHILPNTLGVDVVNENLIYNEFNGTPIQLQPDAGGPWWQQGLRYVSALNITALPELRPGRPSRWVFTFIPTLGFSRRRVVAQGDAAIDGQAYTRWQASLGYGPRLGYQIGRHFIYVDIIFEALWTSINWSEYGQNNTATDSGISAQSEFGYLAFLNPNWSVRLFVRAQNETTQAWTEALRRTSPAVNVSGADSATLTTSGVELAYTFETILANARISNARVRDAQKAPQ